MKKEKCKCQNEDKKCDCQENLEECTCHEEEKCNCEDENLYEVKLNEAYNKISEIEDSLLRSKADFINYRKRLEEEQTKMLKYKNEDIVKEILPIIDNFERAIKATEEETNMLEGVKMIYCSLVNLLNKYEVIEIDCLNKEFDPTFAQAVIQEPSEEVESGIVIDILQKGYTLKGKVIRPAMVKVSE